MKLNEIITQLNLEVLTSSDNLNVEITGGYCSDLLSDVMGNASSGNIWITLQVHKNILAVATLRDIPAIILVKNLRPDVESLELSRKEGLIILSTHLSAFEVAGKLYKLLGLE